MRESPLESSLGVERQQPSQDFEATFDSSAVCEQIWLFARISQEGADFIFQFTDDAFRIDSYPAPALIEEHVVVLEIAVQ